MRVIIMLPFVHRPSFERMRASLSPLLSEGALVIDNTEENLGAAGSRNVGARALLEQDADWLVDISPVTRFGPPGGEDFVAQLADHPEAWVVQSSAPVNWHCIAWNAAVFRAVGLFDENFWPIYGEDADMSRRLHLAFQELEATGAWACVDTDAWVTMYGHSRTLAGIEPNMVAIWRYYEAKWGGRSGQERHARPFGDTAAGLGFWPLPPDPRSIYQEVRR